MGIRSMYVLISFTVVFTLTCFSQSKPNESSPTCATVASEQTSPSEFDQRYPRYQLRPGDSFDVVFEYVPDFNQSVTVQPDGFVMLREVGDVHVAGRTIPDLQQKLCSAYGKILYSPSVAINLKDFDKPYFIVNGEVARPGKYGLRSETTVTEALAVAGGLTEKSKHSQVVLFRHVSSEWTEARLIDVKKMFNSRNLKEDMYLHPGDMIYVPQNKISKIAHYLPRGVVSTYVNPAQY